MWQSCFADGTRGLTAAARCTRLQPASGEHAARLRLKRSFSAPHISYCMGQYSCLHTPSQAGLLSVFTVRVPRLPVLSAPVYVFTVEGLRFRHSASQSPSRCSAATVFPVRVPRAALSSSLCMYGPRHSDSVTARVRVRHRLRCSAATVFTVRVPRAGQLSVYSRSEGLRVRGRVRHGDSRARLLSRRRCLPTRIGMSSHDLLLYYISYYSERYK
jgi:hypothetical protein